MRKELFFEAIRSKVLVSAKHNVIGYIDEFILDTAIFTPAHVVLEEDAELQLFAYLNSLYPGLVVRQKILPDGSRIDLAMKDYGVEVKFVKRLNKPELDRAVGQAIGYTRFFDRVILVLYHDLASDRRLRELAESVVSREPRVSVIVKKVYNPRA